MKSKDCEGYRKFRDLFTRESLGFHRYKNDRFHRRSKDDISKSAKKNNNFIVNKGQENPRENPCLDTLSVVNATDIVKLTLECINTERTILVLNVE